MKELGKCHRIAEKVLGFEKEYAEFNGQVLEDINCVYYEQPGENGQKLIVSITDKTILWTLGFIPMSAHLEAFKDGIRTSEKILKQQYNVLV